MSQLAIAYLPPDHPAKADPHQLALYRLVAVAQYLYDTTGDADSDRPSPLPGLATEHLRKAQAEIDEAIKQGQRTRRRCIGGELVLRETPTRMLPGHGPAAAGKDGEGK